MNKQYRVHELADVAGVTVKALHHYDRLGLLTPQRTDAGYRVYSENDLERLEQILVLKRLGFGLTRIKRLMDPSSPATSTPPTDAWRLHRRHLEDQRERLSSAIRILEGAEAQIHPGAPPTPFVVKQLVGAVAMHDHLGDVRTFLNGGAPGEPGELGKQLGKKRGKNDARPTSRRLPTADWLALYLDVQTAIDADPNGPEAQSLFARWLALVEAETHNDPAVRIGWMNAWADRRHWLGRTASSSKDATATRGEDQGATTPGARRGVRQRERETVTATISMDAVARFIDEAAWAHGSRQMAEASPSRVPDRAPESRRRLFHQIEAALEKDPEGADARVLVRRWRDLVEEEAGGDPDVLESIHNAWSNRRHWPSGLKRYVASLYESTPDTWERVTDFIDATGRGLAS